MSFLVNQELQNRTAELREVSDEYQHLQMKHRESIKREYTLNSENRALKIQNTAPGGNDPGSIFCAGFQRKIYIVWISFLFFV